MFAFRCLMWDKPFLVVFINIGLSILIFGYAFRLFEYAAWGKWDGNAFWLAIITITTVGYGDVFPLSYPCKVVGVICAFWGVYITSLFVNSVMSFLKSDEADSWAMLLLNNVEEKWKL